MSDTTIETGASSHGEEAHSPGLQALVGLLGSWKMEIRWSSTTHAMVGGPAEVEGAARFAWIEDGRFLVLHQGGTGGPPQARWVIGGDDTSGEYSVLYGDARGVSRIYRMTFQGGLWKVWRSASGFHQRFEGQLSSAGTRIEGRWDKSGDGVVWEHDFDLVYTRTSR